MMMQNLKIKSNKNIVGNIYETVFECPNNMPEIIPGQFINIYPKNESLTLPRPISICDFTGDELKIIYHVVGKGTSEFSRYLSGDWVKVMLPLGNGYRLPTENRNHVLIGGGIGVPPLIMLAKSLKGNVSVFLGFKDNTILIDEFKKITNNVYITTESGSFGEKGFVTDLLKKYDAAGEEYYCCGPTPMLMAVSSYLKENNKNGQISVEERMACGFGVCVGCAVKIQKQGEPDWQYLKACKDGPVFDYREVLWD